MLKSLFGAPINKVYMAVTDRMSEMINKLILSFFIILISCGSVNLSGIATFLSHYQNTKN